MNDENGEWGGFRLRASGFRKGVHAEMRRARGKGYFGNYEV
jgi:hypothetical protein